MRIIYLIVFLSLIRFSTTNAQSYLPIFGQSNEWYLNYFETIYGTEYYNYSEDTIIQDTVWHFLDNYHFNKGMLVREDTLLGKVWGIPLFGDLEDSIILLYDFTLQAGDSFYVLNGISPLPSDAGWFDVDSTTTIVYEGIPRKTLFLTARDSLKASSKGSIWIEGIGSNYLLSTPGAMASLNTFGELSCAFKDGIPVYKSDIAKFEAECEFKYLNTNSSSPLTPVLSTKIYPIPATNNINIETIGIIHSIEIFNLKGEQVLKIHSLNQSFVQVSTETLRSGMYFIRLQLLTGEIETLYLLKL